MSMDEGTEPAKMYFSEGGMRSKISGARRKFLERTDLGVWAVWGFGDGLVKGDFDVG